MLSTRPGRIDKAIELTYMEPADKKRIACRILGAYENECLRMVHFVDQYPELLETPAQFQERCAQVALKCFWKELQEVVRERIEEQKQMLERVLVNGKA